MNRGVFQVLIYYIKIQGRLYLCSGYRRAIVLRHHHRQRLRWNVALGLRSLYRNLTCLLYELWHSIFLLLLGNIMILLKMAIKTDAKFFKSSLLIILSICMFNICCGDLVGNLSMKSFELQLEVFKAGFHERVLVILFIRLVESLLK